MAVSNSNTIRNNFWKFGFITYDYKNQIEELDSNNFDGKLKKVNSHCFPQASNIIELAKYEIKMGKLLSADRALPVYLRNNIAKKNVNDYE